MSSLLRGLRNNVPAEDDSGDDNSDEVSNAGGPRELVLNAPQANKPQVDPRQTIFLGIKDDLSKGKSVVDLVRIYDRQVGECKRNKSTKDTVLHWTIGLFESYFDKEALEAIHCMTEVVLEAEPKLLESQNQDKKTPLHLIMAFEEDKMHHGLQLLETICDGSRAWRDALGRAAALPDKNNETCVHLAITKKLEIAIKLIEIAEVSAFSIQRASLADDENLVDGNTPLHDAVAYGRCVFPRAQCVQKPPGKSHCHKCREIERRFADDIVRIEAMVRLLVRRCDEALTVKNGQDESPYLHLVSTEKKHKEKYSPSSDPRLSLESAPTKNAEGGTSGNATPRLADDARLAAPSHKKPVAQLPRKKTDECSEKNGKELVVFLKSFLTESAFAIGGFAQACKCFIGDIEEKAGKYPPFRLGYPIIYRSHENYRALIRKDTEILPHAHFKVGSTVSKVEVGKTASLEEQTEAWNKNMGHLVEVFDMLRELKIKRILKVTVEDNSDRPCTDSVIMKCLRDFDVRYLDWQKNDLCIDVVLAVAPRVSELRLYSSGNATVLRGWAASSGLCSLNQLTKLRLVAHTVRNLRSTDFLLPADLASIGLTTLPTKGYEEYADYKNNVNTFISTVTENIAMTRWKLLLQSERQECKEAVDNLKAKLRKMKKKQKKPSDGNQERGNQRDSMLDRGVAGPQDLTNSIGDSNKNQIAPFDQEDTEEISRLKSDKEEKTKQLQRLYEVWDLVEEKRKPRELGPIPTDKPTEIQSNCSRKNQLDDSSTVDFLKLEPSRSAKLFPSAGGEGEIAWRFEVEQPPKMDADPRPQPETDSRAKLKNMMKEVKSQASEVGTSNTDTKINTWLTTVGDFVSERGIQSETGEVKVALIDDGVDLRKVNNIYPEGWPPVGPTSESDLWYTSTNEHGTRMAELICRVCPRARIYVAKLVDWDDAQHKDNLGKFQTAKSAAEAVKWAIGKGVQIISMSWTLSEDPDKANRAGLQELDRQIQMAASRNIVMFCAAADEARYYDGRKLYPKSSDTRRLTVVGSAKESGDPSEFVDREQVSMLFPGENIEGLDNLNGSSAATALASGLAALIIWCMQKKKERLPAPAENIPHFFKHMKPAGSEWVNVHRLLKYGGNIQEVDQVVQQCKSWLNTD